MRRVRKVGGGGASAVTAWHGAEPQWTDWHFRLPKSIPSLNILTALLPLPFLNRYGIKQTAAFSSSSSSEATLDMQNTRGTRGDSSMKQVTYQRRF